MSDAIDEKLFDKVKEGISRYARNKEAPITATSSLFEELDIDSLDFVDLVSDLEDLCEIRISDEALQGVVTVSDLIRVVQSLQQAGAQ